MLADNTPTAAQKKPPAKKKKKSGLMLDIMQLVLKIVLIVGCIFAMFTFVYGIARVPDISMSPSIKDGDLVMYYRLDKMFSIGDVTVVQYQDGLVVNGAVQVSQDIFYPTTQYAQGVSFPLTVGDGQVFLLGDNRTRATDSRIYGCVDIADTQGKVIAVIRTRGI